MVLTPSSMIPLESVAPDFELLNVVTDKSQTLQGLKSDKATVIMFICNHCPYVKHIQNGLVKISDTYIQKGISFIGISSNDVINYPDDAPKKMAEIAKEYQYSFPYLYDESQKIAKAYHAECTPDIFVYDNNLKLIYRGQFDDSRPGNNIPVTGTSLIEVLDRVLNNEPVPQNQKPSIGCNIKWKK